MTGKGPIRVLLVAILVGGMVEFDGTVLFLGLDAIGSDFHARVGDLALAASALTLGSVLGLPLAAFADARGRRPGLAIATAGFAVANFLTGLAPTLPVFAVSRLVAVCFASTALGLTLVLVAEMAPPGRRSLHVAILTIGQGAGAGVSSVVYALVAPHWRLLYLVGGAALLLVPLVLAMPESRAWEDRAVGPPALRTLNVSPWRARVAVMAAVSLMSLLAYQPAGIFGALFATRRLGLNPVLISTVLLASAPALVAGYLAGGWISDRAGRRGPGAGLTFATAVLAAVTYLGSTTGYWAGSLGWALFNGAGSPVVATWFTELVPTRARATAQAIAAVAGAAGGVAGLLFVRALEPQFGLGPVLVALTAGPLLASVLLLALPETRGRRLVD